MRRVGQRDGGESWESTEFRGFGRESQREVRGRSRWDMGPYGGYPGPTGRRSEFGAQGYEAEDATGSYERAYDEGPYRGESGRDHYGRDPYGRDQFGNRISDPYLRRGFPQFGQGAARRGRGPKNYKRSDERIREDVCDRLRDSDLNCEDVEVDVENGVVTLTGTADSGHTRRAIDRLIESVSGVTEVANRIRIRREAAHRATTGIR